MDAISFFNTHIDESAIEMVSKTLTTTFISEGKAAKHFEEELEKTFNTYKLATVNSGTSALHLSLVLAEISEGDEVIIPSQTFIATGLAVLMQKATPVFADINYEDGNISVESVKKLITKKTKAIIPVHWAGRPCDLTKLEALALEHNLVIVEDAAHALGSKYEDKFIGSISEYTCFSFQAIKHLTTGDGGAISCRSLEKYEEAKRRRWFGLDRKNSKVSFLGERDCDVTELGYKYHLNDFAATLGLANLKNFNDRIEKRFSISHKYNEIIESKGNMKSFLQSDSNRFSSSWLYGIHTENRDEFIVYMKEKNIPVSVVHQGIDHFSIFKDFQRDLPVQRKFDETQIHLPVHEGLTDDQVNYIVESLDKF